jgi:hypothetical protein
VVKEKKDETADKKKKKGFKRFVALGSYEMRFSPNTNTTQHYTMPFA